MGGVRTAVVAEVLEEGEIGRQTRKYLRGFVREGVRVCVCVCVCVCHPVVASTVVEVTNLTL